MATSSISSSLISSSSSASNSSSLHSPKSSRGAVRVHSRRGSMPSALNTIKTTGSEVSSSGGSFTLTRERVQSFPSSSLPSIINIIPPSSFPTLALSKSSSFTYPPISTPNADRYTLPSIAVFNSDFPQRAPISDNFLKVPIPSKTIRRSNSFPLNPLTQGLSPNAMSVVTSSSRGSFSKARISPVGKHYIYTFEPKENKEQEGRLPLRDGTKLMCIQKMQWADDYAKTESSEGLRKAIELYHQVILSENRSATPWVEPYFKLVKLLSKTSNNPLEILSVLDQVNEKHFPAWNVIDALIKKARLLKKSREFSDVDKALACFKRAEVLVKALTSAEDEIRQTRYLKHLAAAIAKIMKKKQTIDQYLTQV